MRRLGRVVAVWRCPIAYRTCARLGRPPASTPEPMSVFEVSEKMRTEANGACETAKTENSVSATQRQGWS
jgi:hypothetical protein